MADEPDNAQRALPTAPPPPQEVKVRTLKSDLASIAVSGGGLPRYKNVRIAAQQQKNEGGSSGLLTTIAIIVLAAIIIAIGFYFVNQLVLKK